MTEVHAQQVGKRWFKLIAFDDPTKNPIAEVEASYVITYLRWDGKQGKYLRGDRVWTITGLGARKYRQQIIDHLEGKYFS